MDYKDALVATASVAAVLWTGGLIVRQLYANVITNSIVSGMEFCMFSALASIFGLIFIGGPLVFAAGVFFLYYLRQYFVLWLSLRDLNAPWSPHPRDVTNDEGKKQWEQNDYEYLRNYGYELVPYIIVMLFPTQFVVALVSVVMLYFGYQGILGRLNTAWSAPIMRQRDKLKLDRMKVKYERQFWDKQWQVGIAQILAEIRDRLPPPSGSRTGE